MKKMHYALLLTILVGCAHNHEVIIKETKREIPVANIYARIETTPVLSKDDAADDPAIWFNAESPQKSLILGTDKQRGLQIYDLQGKLIGEVLSGRVNNVDIREKIEINNDVYNLAVATNRSHNTLDIYTINPGDAQTVRLLGQYPLNLPEPYGLCAHKNALKQLSVFLNDKNGTYQQWDLKSLKPLEFEKKTEFQLQSQPEGCSVDDTNAVLYLGEENRGLWSRSIDPQNSQELDLIDEINTGALVADVEGMDIYYAKNGSRYLVVSSQGDNSYAVYALTTPVEYKGSFRVIHDTGSGIDGTQETDGLSIHSENFGGVFSEGIVVIQDGYNRHPKQAQNFKYIAWKDIAEALKLNN